MPKNYQGLRAAFNLRILAGFIFWIQTDLLATIFDLRLVSTVERQGEFCGRERQPKRVKNPECFFHQRYSPLDAG